MKARILLVDDDPLQRRVLCKWLSLDDYDLIEAQDGTSAWQEVRRQPPDLIISDWMMPGMDGLDLCRLLRSNPSTCHCYVILLTARDDSTSLVAGLETGADEFLTKPIDGTSLRARVKAGLRQYQHRSTLQAANAQLESLALTDALTGAGNRRALDIALEALTQDGPGRSLSALVVDFDYFKKVNDTYGHMVGDEVLNGFVPRIRTHLRTGDQVFRYGGEEFVIVLPKTDAQHAGIIANRLCEAVRATPLQTSCGPIHLTVSIGAAQILPGDDQQGVALLASADKALYEAKKDGRDCVVVANQRVGTGTPQLLNTASTQYWGYYLFDPEGRAHRLAQVLLAYHQLTVVDEVTLRSNQPCDLTHITQLHSFLSNQLSPERLKWMRIYAAQTPEAMNNPVACALRSVPLKQLLLQSEVWAPLEPTNATHLFSVFQPIFSLKDGSCFGHEALIRGRAKNGTTVSAARVFEYIESTGFIHEFDELARIIHLDSIDQLQPHGHIFMNLIPSSPEQSAREIPRLLNALALLDRPLNQFVLEVTTSHQQTVEQLHSSLRLYREAGFTLALDDLGASSVPLSSLIDLDPAFAKIDRSLIDHIDSDPDRQLLVRAITELAHSRSIQVIAEGIEREDEVIFCRNLGIELGQGFLLGCPNEQPYMSTHTVATGAEGVELALPVLQQ